MRSFLMVVVSILVILAVWVVAGVVVMSVVVDRRGVERASVPEGALIETAVDGADVADAYTMKVRRARIPEVAKLAEHAYVKGDSLTAQTANEMLYTGHSPGVTYKVSYMWQPDEDEDWARVTVSTAVRYVDWKRRFNPIYTGPSHRLLTQFLLSEAVKNAAKS